MLLHRPLKGLAYRPIIEILRQLERGMTFAYELCLINFPVFSPVSER